AGSTHTVGLRADGTVVAKGDNSHHQCNVDGWSDIVAIAAGSGSSHTVGLRADGTVVAKGQDRYLQCKVGGWTDIVAIDAGFFHTLGLRADGTVVAAGQDISGIYYVGDWTDIVAIAAGHSHLLGLRADGTVVARGSYLHGPSCDLADWGGIKIPVLPKNDGSRALLPDGAETIAGEEGADLAAAYAEAEALLASGETYAAVRAFYAIRDYRDAWQRCFDAWGAVTERKTFDAGAHHSVGLFADGTVAAEGNEAYGQCEVGGWSDIVAVSTVWQHTVGLRSDGSVVAAGNNDYGQCEVGSWRDIVAVSAGGEHTVGLRADGTVVAAGNDADGRCAVGAWSDIVAVSAGWGYTVGLRSDGTVVAVGDDSYRQCEVDGGGDIVAIAAGASQYTLGLRSDGTVVATGWDACMQCDVGDWRDIVAIAAGYYQTLGLRSDGAVVFAGRDSTGVYDFSAWRDIVAVAAGHSHLLGLRADGSVVSMGSYLLGQNCNAGGWTGIKIPTLPKDGGSRAVLTSEGQTVAGTEGAGLAAAHTPQVYHAGAPVTEMHYTAEDGVDYRLFLSFADTAEEAEPCRSIRLPLPKSGQGQVFSLLCAIPEGGTLADGVAFGSLIEQVDLRIGSLDSGKLLDVRLGSSFDTDLPFAAALTLDYDERWSRNELGWILHMKNGDVLYLHQFVYMGDEDR
ncbi:MAG: hypothetical protein IK095_08345, partial [Oscillospiraceae bacterium]|nr:hypothetical protein [Oscillospiraceae bacterium]